LVAFVSYWNLLLNKLKWLWVAFYDGLVRMLFLHFSSSSLLVFGFGEIFTSAVSANLVCFWVLNWTKVIPEI